MELLLLKGTRGQYKHKVGNEHQPIRLLVLGSLGTSKPDIFTGHLRKMASGLLRIK